MINNTHKKYILFTILLTMATIKTLIFSTVIEINSQAEFNKIVLQSTKPVAVKVSAPWCGPCKKLAPIFKKISDQLRK